MPDPKIGEVKRRAVKMDPPSNVARVPKQAPEIRIPMGAAAMAEAIQKEVGPPQEAPQEPQQDILPKDAPGESEAVEEAKAQAALEVLRQIFEERNEFMTEENRIAVEARCKEMDLADLLELSEIRQEVPIWPGLLTVVYRTPPYLDVHAANRLITDEGKARQNMEALYRLTLSVHSINGEQLASYKGKTAFDDKSFLARADKFLSMPMEYLQVLDANYLWFHARLMKLMHDGMKLKNGQ